jgi:hypothetical protein
MCSLAAFHAQLQVAGGEGAHEDHRARGLADVDEAAGAGQPRPEAADVEVALRVGLRQPQHRHVQAAAVVEVELAGLVDDGLRVDRGAEVQPAGRNAADDTGLGRQRDEVDHLLFGGHLGHALGHADAQVDHGVARQFQRRAARDHLAFAQRHGRQRGHGHADLARIGRAVGRGEGLHGGVRLLGHHHAADQHAGDLHLPRVQRCRVRRCARPAR